jgi:DNA-binding transcriptional regulator YiaG
MFETRRQSKQLAGGPNALAACNSRGEFIIQITFGRRATKKGSCPMAVKHPKSAKITGSGRVDSANEDDARRQKVGGCDKKLRHASPVLVQALCEKLGLTQSGLASLLAIPVATLQSWEQTPSLMGTAAQTLLTLLDREPESMQRALLAIRLDPLGPQYPIRNTLHGLPVSGDYCAD